MKESEFTIFVSTETLPRYSGKPHCGALTVAHLPAQPGVSASPECKARIIAPWLWGSSKAPGAEWGFLVAVYEPPPAQVPADDAPAAPVAVPPWRRVGATLVLPDPSPTVVAWATTELGSFLEQGSLALDEAPLVGSGVTGPTATGFVANLASQMAPIPHVARVSHVLTLDEEIPAGRFVLIPLVALVSPQGAPWELHAESVIRSLNDRLIMPAAFEEGVQFPLTDPTGDDAPPTVSVRCAAASATSSRGRVAHLGYHDEKRLLERWILDRFELSPVVALAFADPEVCATMPIDGRQALVDAAVALALRPHFSADASAWAELLAEPSTLDEATSAAVPVIARAMAALVSAPLTDNVSFVSIVASQLANKIRPPVGADPHEWERWQTTVRRISARGESARNLFVALVHAAGSSAGKVEEAKRLAVHDWLMHEVDRGRLREMGSSGAAHVAVEPTPEVFGREMAAYLERTAASFKTLPASPWRDAVTAWLLNHEHTAQLGALPSPRHERSLPLAIREGAETAGKPTAATTVGVDDEDSSQQGVLFFLQRTKARGPTASAWLPWRCVHAASAPAFKLDGVLPSPVDHRGGSASASLPYLGHSPYAKDALRKATVTEGSGRVVRNLVDYDAWQGANGEHWSRLPALGFGFGYRAAAVYPYQCGALPLELAEPTQPWAMKADPLGALVIDGVALGRGAFAYERTRSLGAPVVTLQRSPGNAPPTAIAPSSYVPAGVVPLARDLERVAITPAMDRTALFATGSRDELAPDEGPVGPIDFRLRFSVSFRDLVVVGGQGTRLKIWLGDTYSFSLTVTPNDKKCTYSFTGLGDDNSRDAELDAGPVHLSMRRTAAGAFELGLETSGPSPQKWASSFGDGPSGSGNVSFLVAPSAITMSPPTGDRGRPADAPPEREGDGAALLASTELTGAPILVVDPGTVGLTGTNMVKVSDLKIAVRPPPVDDATWDYRIGSERILNPNNNALREHQVYVRAGREIGIDANQDLPPTDPNRCDLHLDDPSVDGLVVELVPLFARRDAQAYFHFEPLTLPWKGQNKETPADTAKWPPKKLTALLLAAAQLDGARGATVACDANRVQAGETWRLTVRAFITEDEADLMTVGARAHLTPWSDGLRKGYLGPAAATIIEAVTNRWIPAGKPDADVEPVAPAQAMLTLKVHGRRIGCEAKPYPGTGTDGGWAFKDHALAYLREARLARMRWRWTGRPLPPFRADRLSGASGAPEWTALAFGDRGDDDCVLTEHVLRPLATTKLRAEPDDDLRSQLWRFSLSARSRYAALFPTGQRWPASRANPWRDVFVGAAPRDDVPRPSLRLLLPLTRAKDKQTASSATPVLAVLDDPWFDVAGVAEQLEAEILDARWHMTKEVPSPNGEPARVTTYHAASEVGFDAIRTSAQWRGDVRIRVVGPIGYTRDTASGAQRFAHSAFILELDPKNPDSPPLDWAFLKVSLRRLLPPEAVSGYQATASFDGEHTFDLADDAPRYLDFTCTGEATVEIKYLDMSLPGGEARPSATKVPAGTYRAVIQRATPSRSGSTIPNAWSLTVIDRAKTVIDGATNEVWRTWGVVRKDTAPRPSLFFSTKTGTNVSSRTLPGTASVNAPPIHKIVGELPRYLLSEATPPLWCQIGSASNLHRYAAPGDTVIDDQTPRRRLVATSDLRVERAGTTWKVRARGVDGVVKLLPVSLPAPESKLLVELWVVETQLHFDARGNEVEEYSGMWAAYLTVAHAKFPVNEQSWPDGTWRRLDGHPHEATRLRFRIVEVERRQPGPPEEGEPPTSPWELLWPSDVPEEPGHEIDAKARIVKVSEPIEWIASKG